MAAKNLDATDEDPIDSRSQMEIRKHIENSLSEKSLLDINDWATLKLKISGVENYILSIQPMLVKQRVGLKKAAAELREIIKNYDEYFKSIPSQPALLTTTVASELKVEKDKASVIFDFFKQQKCATQPSLMPDISPQPI